MARARSREEAVTNAEALLSAEEGDLAGWVSPCLPVVEADGPLVFCLVEAWGDVGAGAVPEGGVSFVPLHF